jgi:hypothetical protein
MRKVARVTRGMRSDGCDEIENIGMTENRHVRVATQRKSDGFEPNDLVGIKEGRRNDLKHE